MNQSPNSILTSHERESTKQALLQVGLPLLLSLWQVFELRIAQWVGPSSLANALLEEQRRVVSALVASVESLSQDSKGTTFSPYNISSPSSQFDKSLEGSGSPSSPSLRDKTLESMSVQAKQYQVTLFLLCDAISMDPSLLTTKPLERILAVGGLLEWEQLRAHDISESRLNRDWKSLVGRIYFGEVESPSIEKVNPSMEIEAKEVMKRDSPSLWKQDSQVFGLMNKTVF